MSSSRGRPFEEGNRFGRGRPRGSRNKTTKAAKELLNNKAEPLVGKAIAMAMKGDASMMRALLGYILPAPKQEPVKLGSLPVATLKDLANAVERILSKVISGDITIAEAQGLAKLIQTRSQAIRTEELAPRITALENNRQ